MYFLYEGYPVENSFFLIHYYRIVCLYSRDLLKQTCDFLQPYDEVIEQLSDSKRPNLHRVIPLRRLLLNSCKEDIEDRECMQELKRFLSIIILTFRVSNTHNYYLPLRKTYR